MTSSGSQRIHSCQKNGLFVCFTSSLKSQPHPSELVCLTSGQVDPRVGVGAEVPASFQRDKTCNTLELWHISKYLSLSLILCLMEVVGHLGLDFIQLSISSLAGQGFICMYCPSGLSILWNLSGKYILKFLELQIHYS